MAACSACEAGKISSADGITCEQVIIPLEKEKMLISTAALILMTVVMAMAWMLLTAPQTYLLRQIESQSTHLNSRLMASDMLPSILIESVLDAIEMFVGVFIFSNFNTDMNTVELAEAVLVAINIANLVASNLYLVRKISFWQENDADGDQWLINLAYWRDLVSVVILVIIIPELVMEAIVYNDSLRFTDFICVIALSCDIGIRVNNGVSFIRQLRHGGSQVDLHKRMEAEMDVKSIDDTTNDAAQMNDLRAEIASLQATVELQAAQLNKSSQATFTGCFTAREKNL